VGSCFVLFETSQHCVAKICNASPTANVHKLQNDPFLYEAPYFELTSAPKHALPHHMFRGAWRRSVSAGVSKGQKKRNKCGGAKPAMLKKCSVSDLRRPTVQKSINGNSKY